MTKWTLVVLTVTFALQGAVFGAPAYDDDFKFINLWSEIEIEIKDVVLHLKSGDVDVGTLEKQSEILANVVESVIEQLYQETIDHEQGDIIFKRVVFIFQEVHSALKHIVLFSEHSNPLETKSKLIYNLETVVEHMEQLVFIAKTYCPQLRALLRAILKDFLDFVRGFRTKNEILEKEVVIYESPERMVGQINEITKQFTDLLNQCNHMEEMRMLLRGYIRYVEEIIHKLEVQKSLGDQEVDEVVQRLTDELRKMFVPLMKMILHEEHVDIKTFRTDLIARFFSIVSVFDTLLHTLNSTKCSVDAKNFIERIIYFYYYATKQTHFETRTAFKNSFYGRKYHDEFFEEDHRESLRTKNESLSDKEDFLIESPEELVLRLQKLAQRLNQETLGAKLIAYHVRGFVQVVEYAADKISKEVRINRLPNTERVMNGFYEDLQRMKVNLDEMLKKNYVVQTEFVRCVQEVVADLYKIVMVEKMHDNGYEHLLLKDICIEFYNFLSNIFYQMKILNQEPRKPLNGEDYFEDLQKDQHPKSVFIKIIKY